MTLAPASPWYPAASISSPLGILPVPSLIGRICKPTRYSPSNSMAATPTGNTLSRSAACISLLHPGCFSRLIAALAFDHADKRLTVPRFAMGASDSDSGRRPGDRTTPPALGDEELILVAAELAENAR